MKKLIPIFAFVLFACSGVWANTFSQTSQYRNIKTLPTKQLRELARQYFLQSCQQDFPNARYQDCSCLASSIVNEFKDKEIRDLLLPESEWKYLTPAKVVTKMQEAGNNTYTCMQFKFER